MHKAIAELSHFLSKTKYKLKGKTDKVPQEIRIM